MHCHGGASSGWQHAATSWHHCAPTALTMANRSPLASSALKHASTDTGSVAEISEPNTCKGGAEKTVSAHTHTHTHTLAVAPVRPHNTYLDFWAICNCTARAFISHDHTAMCCALGGRHILASDINLLTRFIKKGMACASPAAPKAHCIVPIVNEEMVVPRKAQVQMVPKFIRSR